MRETGKQHEVAFYLGQSLAAARDLGLSSAQMKAVASLLPGGTAGIIKRVPLAPLMELIRACEEKSGDPAFRFRLSGYMTSLEELGPLGMLMASSPTPMAAFFEMAKFMGSMEEEKHFWQTDFRFQDGGCHIRFASTQAPGLSQQAMLELGMANIVALTHTITGQGLQPRRLRLAHASLSAEAGYRAFFQAPVDFAAGENVLEFGPEFMTMPCLHASRHLSGKLAREIFGDADGETDRTVADSARAIEECIHTGKGISLEAVAALLNRHPRTVQQQLKAQGTTFGGVLAGVRRVESANLLRESTLKVEQIAARLGYHEPSSFQRAFRGWYGLPPGQYRKMIR